jgi:argininosuccinate synthase
VPAAAISCRAPRAREARRHDPPEPFKPALDEQWAYLVYAGLWYEPLLENLNAFMDSSTSR